MILSKRHTAQIKLYNSLTKKKQFFKPQKEKETVKIYVCGPTVYDFAHIGNLRAYIFGDTLRRTLKLFGYRIFQVMNITDIDDKIIKLSVSSKKAISKITIPFEKYFFEDISKLNIELPEKIPRATEHIKDMIILIEKLIAKGYAYENNGSVYFDISKFKKYGKLARVNNIKNKPPSARRITADEYKRDEIEDFVLWKAKKPEEPFWESPWGKGRPGWHIECSAMSQKYLGDTLDIHTGGVDNVFPHHENEIAQSEAATGKPFSRFFMHGEHLLVGGAKMAKSVGNFYTLRDIEKKGYDPLSFRYLCLQTHYRSKMNFSWKSLDSAETALKKLRQLFASVKNGNNQKNYVSSKKTNIEKGILDALKDDLNSPKALSFLWNALKNKNFSTKEKIALINSADKSLGLKIAEKDKKPKNIDFIPNKIKTLAEKRNKLRENGCFVESDKIRNEIEKKGYEIIDEKKGYKLIKKNYE